MTSYSDRKSFHHTVCSRMLNLRRCSCPSKLQHTRLPDSQERGTLPFGTNTFTLQLVWIVTSLITLSHGRPLNQLQNLINLISSHNRMNIFLVGVLKAICLAVRPSSWLLGYWRYAIWHRVADPAVRKVPLQVARDAGLRICAIPRCWIRNGAELHLKLFKTTTKNASQGKPATCLYQGTFY